MNYSKDKYDLVVISAMWAKHLSRNDEFKNKPHASVIKAALAQILNNEVSNEEIMKVWAEEKEARAKMELEEEARKKKEAAKLKDVELEIAE